MANEPQITFTGNLTDIPVVKTTPKGIAFSYFTVATTPRNKQGETWVDGNTIFLRCVLWGNKGEAASEQLNKGETVLVTGKLVLREYETKDGKETSSFQVTVDELAKLVKPKKSSQPKTESFTADW